jgi:hypothetical protein
MSKITQDGSDALCRLATGAGIRRRKLRTDDTEIMISLSRPVILNSIVQGLIEAGDLASRALVVRTKSFGEGKTTEEGLRLEFEKNRPLIFGALLSAVSIALKNLPNVSMRGLPRMADFSQWCIAGETGLGLAPGSFVRAYEANRTLIVGSALDASPIHEAIITIIKEKGYWKGDVKALYGEILRWRSLDGGTWPKSYRALRAHLDRIIPGLRREGVDVRFLGRDGYTRRSVLEIRSRIASQRDSNLFNENIEPEAVSSLVV